MAKHQAYRNRVNKDIQRIRKAGGDGALARAHANAGLKLKSRDFAKEAIRVQRDSAEFYQELKADLQETFETIQSKVNAGEDKAAIQTYFTDEVKRIQDVYLDYIDTPLKETINAAFERIGPLFRQHEKDRKEVYAVNAENMKLQTHVDLYKERAEEAKTAAEALQAANDALEQRVADLTRKGDVAGAIAEALRNYTPPAIPKADQATLNKLKNL